MNKSDCDTPTRWDVKFFLLWGAFALLVGAALLWLFSFLGIMSTPGAIVSKTLDSNNVITSYEWFYDTNAQYEARLGQIRSHAPMVLAEADAKEKSRLHIEVQAMRQSCRDLVTKYNANSQKMNKSLFKSKNLPEELPLRNCEV